MPEPGRTAVVIPLPDLDPLLDAVAARWPEAVRPGVPAHLTVLYPFLPAARLTEEILAECRALCAGTGPVRIGFARADAGPTMVSVPPVPAGPVAALARSFVARWPECPPYGGRFGPDPEPHVTLALGAGADDRARIAALAGEFLPLQAEPEAAVLVELTEQGWCQRATLPL